MLNAKLAAVLHKVRSAVPAEADLRLDSRRIEAGDVFLAVPGLKNDGRAYIAAALEKGASAVLYEPGNLPENAVPSSDRVIAAEGLSEALGVFSSAYYGNPSEGMQGLAVTGTNGKTTTSQWMAELLSGLGHPCGVLGTIGCAMSGKSYSSVPLTTPDPVTLQKLLHDLKKDGAEGFAIEASSIGLVQGRLSGTAIRGALFTNLTRDHLDYHGTMQAYEEAKTLLFTRKGLEFAVINTDDPAGLRMCRAALLHGVRVIAATACGTEAPQGCEKLEARNVKIGASGISFALFWQGREYPVKAGVLGLFNADNLLGAIGMMLALGFSAEKVIPLAEKLVPPAGRLQIVTEPGLPMGVVDYCHTPDAIEKALQALRPVADARGGKLIAVLGAGGNRDAGKRPIMGRTGEAFSDALIITSDNPRFEDPAAIAAAVAEGVRSPRIILDRREALFTVFSEASPEDVVLVAGKGHEDYQEICGVKHHFSDAETVREALTERRKQNS